MGLEVERGGSTWITGKSGCEHKRLVPAARRADGRAECALPPPILRSLILLVHDPWILDPGCAACYPLALAPPPCSQGPRRS